MAAFSAGNGHSNGDKSKKKEDEDEGFMEKLQNLKPSANFFDELKEIEQGGGKPKNASLAVMRPRGDNNPQWPSMMVRAVDEAATLVEEDLALRLGKGGPSLITVIFRGNAVDALDEWMLPWREVHGNGYNGHVPHKKVAKTKTPMAHYHISYVETFIFRRLGGMVARGLRESIPGPRHPYTFVRTAAIKPFNRPPLAFGNRLVPYLFLVDSTGAIRWSACGAPAPGEVEMMIKASQTLIDEGR